MRRTFVLISSAAIACVAITLAAAPVASPQVICPLAGTAGPPITSCCGPPVAVAARGDRVRRDVTGPAAAEPATTEPRVMPIGGCCPGNAAMCVNELSISSSPNPSTAPRKVVISGRLLSGSGPVVLWERLPGQRQFHQLTARTPDSSGQYTATVAPSSNREWYAAAHGLRSVTMQQQVQAVVKLSASASKGGAVTLHGLVTPSHARERVMLEVRSGSGWRVVARARLDEHSRLHVKLASPASGQMVLEAVFPGDSRNVRSSSAPVTVP